MKSAALLLPFFLIAAPLHAADPASPPKSPAERILALMDFDGTAMAGAKVVFQPFLDQLKTQGMPPEGVKEVSDAADAYFTRTFQDPDLRKDMAKLYESRFTASELEEMLRFYDTPLGRKTLKTMPELMTEGGKIGQQYAQKHQGDFQDQLQQIMGKYKDQLHQPDKEPAGKTQ